MYGELEDTRIAVPNNCLTMEYPEELRAEALTRCQEIGSNIGTVIATETDCEKLLYVTFEQFIDDVISAGVLEDTRTITPHPDNYVEKDPTDLNKEAVKYSVTKDGVTTIGLLSDLKDGVIDSGTIGINPNTIEYEYRMWIDNSVTDNSAISGKSLSYKIDVEISQVLETALTKHVLLIQ